LKWTWELTRKDNTLVGTNSVTANTLIGESLRRGYIYGFKTARRITGERFCGRRTRIDFEVTLRTGKKHFIEVKNCHLRYPDGNAYFPDSKTQRSVRHLWHLRRLIREGRKASLFIAIQRADVKSLRPSDFHDPKFSGALRRAAAVGVAVRAFSFRPTTRGFRFSREIPVDLSIYGTSQIRKWSERQRRFSGWSHWNSEKDIS
jgi:sugar fermentation stimulation protein A